MILFGKFKRYGYRRAFVYLLLRFFQMFRGLVYRYLFSDNNAVLDGVSLNQPVQFVGKGQITLRGVSVGVWPSPGFLSGYAYFEARSCSASIEVAEGTFFNNGAVIIADRGRISIGRKCLVGLNFSAVDSDFHSLDVCVRGSGSYECADVLIGDDVFIGSDVKILKGVKIGDGAVIGSGSLVVHDVPGMTVYAGVPAKFIRAI